MRDDLKTGGGQARAIFVRLEARVIERLSIEVAYDHGFGVPAGEKEMRAWSSMRGEDWKHRALIVRR